MFTEGMDPKLAQIVGGIYELLTDTPKEREQKASTDTKYVLASNLRVGDQISFFGDGVHQVRSVGEYGDDVQLSLGLVGPNLTSVVVYKNYMVEVLTPTEV